MQCFVFIGFWLNALNKVCGSHKLRYIHILFYDIKYVNTLFWYVLSFVLKKAVTNKWLNGTTKIVRTLNYIKCSSYLFEWGII